MLRLQLSPELELTQNHILALFIGIMRADVKLIDTPIEQRQLDVSLIQQELDWSEFPMVENWKPRKWHSKIVNGVFPVYVDLGLARYGSDDQTCIEVTDNARGWFEHYMNDSESAAADFISEISAYLEGSIDAPPEPAPDANPTDPEVLSSAASNVEENLQEAWSTTADASANTLPDMPSSQRGTNSFQAERSSFLSGSFDRAAEAAEKNTDSKPTKPFRLSETVDTFVSQEKITPVDYAQIENTRPAEHETAYPVFDESNGEQAEAISGNGEMFSANHAPEEPYNSGLYDSRTSDRQRNQREAHGGSVQGPRARGDRISGPDREPRFKTTTDENMTPVPLPPNPNRRLRLTNEAEDFTPTGPRSKRSTPNVERGSAADELIPLPLLLANGQQLQMMRRDIDKLVEETGSLSATIQFLAELIRDGSWPIDEDDNRED